MSGGVDSSVAAHLLIEEGHEVIGVFMRHGEAAVSACAIDGKAESSPLLPVLNNRLDHKQGCCSASDAEDGRRVAQRRSNQRLRTLLEQLWPQLYLIAI